MTILRLLPPALAALLLAVALLTALSALTFRSRALRRRYRRDA